MAVYAPTFVNPGVSCGRLSAESAVWASVTDQTAKTTLYYVFGRLGNLISLYDGSAWQYYVCAADLSLAIGTLTSGKNYDVFCYANAGVPTLELSAAWTSDTARSDALTLQDGVYCKSGALTRKYLGTIRTTSTTTFADADHQRFCWNMYNQEVRSLLNSVSASYTYASTIRQINADASAKVELIVGLLSSATHLSFSTRIETNVDEHGTIDIGENALTAASGSASGQLRDFTGTGTDNKRLTVVAEHIAHPRLGYSYYSMLETATAGTVQWFGGSIRGLWSC